MGPGSEQECMGSSDNLGWKGRETAHRDLRYTSCIRAPFLSLSLTPTPLGCLPEISKITTFRHPKA